MYTQISTQAPAQHLHGSHLALLAEAHLVAWKPGDPLNMEQVSVFVITAISSRNTNLKSFHHVREKKENGGKPQERVRLKGNRELEWNITERLNNRGECCE